MTEKLWDRVSRALSALAIILMICEWASGLPSSIGAFLMIAGLYAGWLGEAAGRKEDRRIVRKANP